MGLKIDQVDHLIKSNNLYAFRSTIQMFKNKHSDIKTSLNQLRQVLTEVKQHQKKYNATFLVKQDESLIPVATHIFAYFNIKSSVVKGITFDAESFIIDRKMESLEDELDPMQFYRINRQFIAQRNAIVRINYGSNGKLVITVSPTFSGSIVVSKAKSKHFKEWMDK